MADDMTLSFPQFVQRCVVFRVGMQLILVFFIWGSGFAVP